MDIDESWATGRVRFSDMFWSVTLRRGRECYIRDGLVCQRHDGHTLVVGGELGENDVYGPDLPTFCEALLNTDWENPDEVVAYHNVYGLYWGEDYEVRFADGTATDAYALARFQAEILSLRTTVDLAGALRTQDHRAVHRLVRRCESAKLVLFDMCRRRNAGGYYSLDVDTSTWHESGGGGTAVRFLGPQHARSQNVDFQVVLEPVPLLPDEWKAVRDAWAEGAPPSGSIPWHPPEEEWCIEDVLAEISDILSVPCVRPYFETRVPPGDLRFFLSWELFDLADFVRLGIAMHLTRGLLPTRCASESCQRYFIPTRPRQAYCSKECQRAQAVRRYRQRQKEQPPSAKGTQKKRRPSRKPKA